MAFAETANLAVKLTLGGNFNSQLAKTRSSLRGFDKDASRAYRAGGQIGTGIKRGFILAGAAATGFAVLVGKSVTAAGDFEAALHTINTIARATPEALGKIGTSIRQIAKDTGTPLDDLTQGYYDLLSAGIKTADAQDVLTQSNKLAIGGLSTTAEAIDLLTTAINTYGGDASQAGKDADIFAKAVERGKVTAAEIAGSFATVGPLASAYAIGIDEIGASYARLTASGVPAAEAATQMRSAIQSLAKPDKALRALEGQTKKNYLGIAGKKGLVVALQEMRTDAKKAGIPLSLLTSRIEAMQFILQTTGPNFKAYQADLKAMGDASGTAASQMAEREQGLNFQLGKLRALAKDAGITIGSALLPKLTPVVSALNDLINAHQGDIAAFGDQLAAAFTPEGVVAGIKSIAAALGPMLELLKVSAAPVKAIVDAFLKLPKEVQTVLVGAFAVNKLTGGLVTNVAGGLAESLLKAVAGGIKAPLVNVQGGVVNVGGGLPGGGGSPAGGLPGALGTAGGIAAGMGAGSLALLGGTVAAFGAGAIFALESHSPLLNRPGGHLGPGDLPANRKVPGLVGPRGPAVVTKGLVGPRGPLDAKTVAAIKAAQAEASRKAAEIKAANIAAAAATRDGASAGRATRSAVYQGTAALVGAIGRQPTPIVNVKVNVTPSQVIKQTTIQYRYGAPNGSGGSSGRRAGAQVS